MMEKITFLKSLQPIKLKNKHGGVPFISKYSPNEAK